MSHAEKRTVWWKEGLLSLGSGLVYGVTSVLVAQPFDGIRTRMAAQQEFLGRGATMTHTFRRVLKTHGIRGLYRGIGPSMLGSIMFRSLQFAVFESVYTRLGSPAASASSSGQTVGSAAAGGEGNGKGWGHQEVGGGVQLRVIAGGFSAGVVRAVIEGPIEYAKVARQTEQPWYWRHIYRGFSLQFARTTLVLTTYFVVVDAARRKTPEVFATTWGQFLVAATASTGAWLLYWPIEVLKNARQADTRLPGMKARPSLKQLMQYFVAEHGLAGIYRGATPGAIRSILANGTSMIAMLYTQRLLTEWGLRDA